MNHLLRERAPITEAGWAELDGEARKRLEPGLAARKVVDFAGPLGWDHSATNLGRIEPLTGGDGVQAARRVVLPLVELRVEFAISRHELADLERGADDIDLAPLEEAARRLAVAENTAVFHGWEAAGIRGIAEAARTTRSRSRRTSTPTPATPQRPSRPCCAAASGSYALALGPDEYTGVIQTAEHGGVPLFDHLKKILQGGPIVWAPGVHGGVVVSLRGGDFLFESGQDLSIGYTNHDAESVQLYLEESFSFRAATPEAACALKPAG